MKKIKPVIFLAFANDKVDDALYLRNLPKELHGLRESLDEAAQAGICEIVERTAATVDQIFDVFQDPTFKDRIAIFHYGGHAGDNQLMLETLEGGHGYSHSDGLVPFFAKQESLQLVFFNGCSSQSQAEEMITAGVPAVIGTSSAIDDEVATDLSIRFYKGLASGESIEQAWLQAIDLIKTKKGEDAGLGGTTGHRGLKLRRDQLDEFPWEMYVRRGAGDVKSWNLPMAANCPLFGLPELPKLNLPESPFRFLRRYQREHAEIFFGRNRMIRSLYERTIDSKTDPVILFYGQSGVGKSSMLDAGLLPRLEGKVDVRYARREEQLGLLGTLDKALGGKGYDTVYIKNSKGEILNKELVELKIHQIEMLSEGFDETITDAIQMQLEKVKTQLYNVEDEIELTAEKTTQTRLQRWKQIEDEDAENEPLVILLDQVEEVFTRPREDDPDELELFLGEVQAIFENPNARPKGKIILSYRKEFHPEIEEICKNFRIPRQNLFLQHLDREDITEVVTGLLSSEKLRNRYQLNIDPELPVIIADDLLEDKNSSIAPLLQILLTKLWEGVAADDVRHFTVDAYQKLRKAGLHMQDFVQERMQKLNEWNPELEESGLALDVLNYHITSLGTAEVRNKKQIYRRYKHREEELGELLSKMKELFLLVELNDERTGLAHDTVAPAVEKEVDKSEKPGQRALRILSSSLSAHRKNPEILLGRASLRTIMKGKDGMRLWSNHEKELIKKSHKKIRRRYIQYGVWTILTIVALSFGVFERVISTITEKEALVREAHLSSSLAAAKLAAGRQEERAKEHERRAKLLEEAKSDTESKSEELINELEKVMTENDTLTMFNDLHLVELTELKDKGAHLEGKIKYLETELVSIQELVVGYEIERIDLVEKIEEKDEILEKIKKLNTTSINNTELVNLLQGQKKTKVSSVTEEGNQTESEENSTSGDENQPETNESSTSEEENPPEKLDGIIEENK